MTRLPSLAVTTFSAIITVYTQQGPDMVFVQTFALDSGEHLPRYDMLCPGVITDALPPEGQKLPDDEYVLWNDMEPKP